MALLENRFRRQKKRHGPLGIPFGPVRSALAEFNPVIRERPKIFAQDLGFAEKIDGIAEKTHDKRAPRMPRESKRVYAHRGGDVEYCLTCIGENHLPKAITLLGEAIKGSGGPRAEKVSEAMGEIAAAEDHAKPYPSDEVRELAEELRSIRKSLWPAKVKGDTKAAESALMKLKAMDRRIVGLLGASGVELDTSDLERASDLLKAGDGAEAKKWIDKHLKKEECSICRDELREAKRLISKKEYGAAQDMIDEIIGAYREIQSEVQ